MEPVTSPMDSLDARRDADDNVDPLAGGEVKRANRAVFAIAIGVDAAVHNAVGLIQRTGHQRRAIVAIERFELEKVTEVAGAGEAGVGAEVERVFKRLIDELMPQPGDPFGFLALAIGVGRVAVAIPPSQGGVVVAQCVAEQTAAFVDVVWEIRGVVLKGVRVGEINDGGFFQPLKAGFVLNHNRRGGAQRQRTNANDGSQTYADRTVAA